MGVLERVENFNPDVPKAAFRLKGFIWSMWFILDYAFSLSKQKKEDGTLYKRHESSRLSGKVLRFLHKSLVNQLVKNAIVTFDGTMPLPSIDGKYIDREFFNHWGRKINMPLVLKGYIKGEEVMDVTTVESLIEVHGQKEVKFVDRNFGKKKNNRVGQNVELLTSTLEEYLTKEEYRDCYINNFYGILDDDDYLERSRGKDIDEFRNQISSISQWFISRRKNSGSTLHCALGDNMFLNIHGKKEWLFIDPTYLPVFKPALAKYGTYTVSELEEELNMDADTYEELVKDFPYLKHIPFYRYELEPGDVLYNPSAWLHTVRNHTDYTVGCAVRYNVMQWDNNSITLSICGLLIAALKNPTKSFLAQFIKTTSGDVKAKKEAIDTIFSKNEKKTKEKVST
ncbi:MAG: hypothetical protein ED557_13070 [Balneola sp.]|nr:MAG: hypothetical protein ED557_13070 [Balneola sp.]